MSKIVSSPYIVLVLFVGLAFFWGVVSFQHFIPSGTDFFVSLWTAGILSIGLLFTFLLIKKSYFSINTIFWLLTFIVFLIQPLINDVTYIDAHMLSVFTILLCVLLSVALAGMNDKQKSHAIHFIAYIILSAGLFTVLSQFVQVLNWKVLSGVLFFMVDDERPIGNIGQVNQAAFVITLAIASVFYLSYPYIKQTLSYSRSVKTLFILAFSCIVTLLLSIGLGFSASRGGLILAAASILGSMLFYQGKMWYRLAPLLYVPFIIIGYQIGTYVMQIYMQTEMSAVSRLVGEQSLHLRVSLLKQAWLAFSSDPITGIGFNNMIDFSLHHANELEWFTVANHTHNIIAQLAAELGIFGIVLFVSFIYLLLKNFSFNLVAYKAYAYVLLLLIGLYSLSEYPLWFFRFLLLTVFLIAIVDNSQYRINDEFRIFNAGISLLFVGGICFYINNYYHYMYAAYTIQSDNTNQETRIELYQSLPNVFGYSQYKELILYMLMPIGTDQLSEQIQLGERVLSNHLDGFLLQKQATLLMLAGEEKQADQMFQALCLFQNGAYCEDAIAYLRRLKEENSIYTGYLNRFQFWYEQKFNKPMLVES